MSAFDDPMVTAVAVVIILFAGMVLNMLTTRRGSRPGTAAAAVASGPVDESAVGRFAIHQGSVVGEVVKVEGDDVVLRQGSATKLLRRSLASLKDGEVVVSGDVDWAEAERRGAEWARAHGDQPPGGA